MIGAIVPQATRGAQATLAAANAIKNLYGTFVNPAIIKDPWTLLAQDIGGAFQFDYIGDQRLEAPSETTVHYAEDNSFFSDHIAIKPVVLTCKGFVSEISQTKLQAIGLIGSLTAVLSPLQPYMTQYSPGTAAKMGAALNQAANIEQQIQKAMTLGRSALKLANSIASKIFPTKCQDAFEKLVGLRNQQFPFMVVTPFRTFGKYPEAGFMMENLVMVSPENSRQITDIIVTLKEIRLATSAGTGGPTNRGSTSGATPANAPTFT